MFCRQKCNRLENVIGIHFKIRDDWKIFLSLDPKVAELDVFWPEPRGKEVKNREFYAGTIQSSA